MLPTVLTTIFFPHRLQKLRSGSWTGKLANMSQFELQRNERIHCRELISGTHRSGFFFINDEKIRADIYSYDGFFYIDTDHPVYLQTETNQIISLHQNIGGPAGTRHNLAETKMTSCHQELISNVAVIGSTRWSVMDC